MLNGYGILNLSNRIGWLAGRLLADLGAEVIKVEPSSTCVDDVDWQAYNVNKRLLRLDLDTRADLSVFDQLVAGYDILIESSQSSDPYAKFMG